MMLRRPWGRENYRNIDTRENQEPTKKKWAILNRSKEFLHQTDIRKEEFQSR